MLTTSIVLQGSTRDLPQRRLLEAADLAQRRFDGRTTRQRVVAEIAEVP